MYKVTFLSFIVLLYNICLSQTIEGHYRAFELNGLTIDSIGNIYFYGIDSFPKEKWFHEVNVTIKGNRITIDKTPVYFADSSKSYSVSDGGFITYSGKLRQAGEIYYVRTKMVDYDYMGLTFFDPPKIDETTGKPYSETDTIKKIDLDKYDKIKKDGVLVYFGKGILTQDYIIRPDKDGIWINNTFYYRQKKMQSQKKCA